MPIAMVYVKKRQTDSALDGRGHEIRKVLHRFLIVFTFPKPKNTSNFTFPIPKNTKNFTFPRTNQPKSP